MIGARIALVIRGAVGNSRAAQAFVRSKALEVDYDDHCGCQRTAMPFYTCLSRRNAGVKAHAHLGSDAAEENDGRVNVSLPCWKSPLNDTNRSLHMGAIVLNRRALLLVN